MKLLQLLQGIITVKVIGSLDTEVTGLAVDSQRVRPGYLFIAVKGQNKDGYHFIEDAIARGAVAVITDREYTSTKGITVLVADSPRDILSKLAARFYNYPGDKMDLIGITGTNGKTTTAYLIKSILEKSTLKTGLLGTINYFLGERIIPANLTTPDVVTINYFLRQMLDNGCRAGVMEVSSHAIDQERIAGIPFNIAVFTNISKDHMDYHKTIEQYLNTKSRLFRSLSSKGWAIVNLDDPYYSTVIRDVSAKVIGYGIRNVSSIPLDYKIKAKAIKFEKNSMDFLIDAVGFGARFSVKTQLIGFHNAYNILAAISVGLAMNIPIDTIQEGILAMKNIPGRLQRIPSDKPFEVFIDYAHSPDALENVLATIRDVTSGKLIVVFGCGGNRDKYKRPVMGRIASQRADYTILTTDNPRDEVPINIIHDIERGFIGDNYKVIVDRKEAIIEGLFMADSGDSVVIAGKGHENYQVFKDTTVPFSDQSVVSKFLAEYKLANLNI